MKFFEIFNQDKLNYVLQNQERYEVKVYEDNYNPFQMPQKYLQRSTKGIKETSYHQPGFRNLGRFFANDSLSLQSMCKEIRHTIAAEFYDDVDIVNAHPVILHHLAQKHGLDCDRLGEYIADRNKYLSELKIENPKEVFLSIINNGSKSYDAVKKPTKFLKRFKREIDDLLRRPGRKIPQRIRAEEEITPEQPDR